jgi:hypothetical protein
VLCWLWWPCSNTPAAAHLSKSTKHISSCAVGPPVVECGQLQVLQLLLLLLLEVHQLLRTDQ